MNLNETSYQNFMQEISAADNQPQRTYQALEQLVNELIGVKLFTIMTYNHEFKEASRSYSNMPDAYPIFGKKPMRTSEWSTKVVVNHETFVANDIDAIKEVFFDYQLIRSLGCESAMNIPIIVAGEVLGTINCLDAAGYFTAERIQASEQIKLLGTLAFLSQAVVARRDDKHHQLKQYQAEGKLV